MLSSTYYAENYEAGPYVSTMIQYLTVDRWSGKHYSVYGFNVNSYINLDITSESGKLFEKAESSWKHNHLSNHLKPQIMFLNIFLVFTSNLIYVFVVAIEMRQLIIIIIIVVLLVSTDGQYPNCIDGCPTSESLYTEY